MADYKLTDKKLKVNNTNYYRSNGIRLGYVGEKKNSIFSVNRIDAQSNIPEPKMKVKYGEKIAMTSKFAHDFAAKISYNGISGSAFRKKLTNGDLKLVRYYMEKRDIENAVEGSPQLIETIRSIGRDARVVSDVWVVVDAKMYAETKGGGKFNYKTAGGAESKVERKTMVELSSDTVFSYMLRKFDWKEKQKKNWAHIERLPEDPKGL